eukprot:SAG31_NODE_162_length_21892_cov_343.171936_12_plen_76_part_00
MKAAAAAAPPSTLTKTAPQPQNSNRTKDTKEGVTLDSFGGALWEQACAAERSGDIRKALGLFQEGIRTTMAAVQV